MLTKTAAHYILPNLYGTVGQSTYVEPLHKNEDQNDGEITNGPERR